MGVRVGRRLVWTGGLTQDIHPGSRCLCPLWNQKSTSTYKHAFNPNHDVFWLNITKQCCCIFDLFCFNLHIFNHVFKSVTVIWEEISFPRNWEWSLVFENVMLWETELDLSAAFLCLSLSLFILGLLCWKTNRNSAQLFKQTHVYQCSLLRCSLYKEGSAPFDFLALRFIWFYQNQIIFVDAFITCQSEF